MEQWLKMNGPNREYAAVSLLQILKCKFRLEVGNVARMHIGRSQPHRAVAFWVCLHVEHTVRDSSLDPRGDELGNIWIDIVSQTYEVASMKCFLTLTLPLRPFFHKA